MIAVYRSKVEAYPEMRSLTQQYPIAFIYLGIKTYITQPGTF